MPSQTPLSASSPLSVAPARAGWVVLGSGLLGFLLWALIFPSWTDNVESAQFLAGVVTAPPDNPLRLYHLTSLSLLIDAAAVGLKLGLSEWTLSVLTSGLQGALIFSGLTACTLALSGNTAVSLLVPVLLLYLQLFSGVPFSGPPYLDVLHGHAYPILLANYPYVFGVAGLFLVLLVWGFFALRYLRVGGVLAGLMLWVHPSMGLACWLGGGAALWFQWPELEREERRGLLTWLGVGTACSLAAFAVHWFWIAPRPQGADMALAERIVRTYVTQWDTHRVIDPRAVPWMLEVDAYVLGLMAVLYGVTRKSLPAGALFLFRGLLAISAVGVGSLLAQPYLPLDVRVLMLHRWLNLNSLAFPVLVFGMLGYWGFRQNRPLALGALLLNAVMILSLAADSLTFAAHGGYRGDAGAWRGLLFPLLGGGAVCLLAVRYREALPAPSAPASRRLALAGTLVLGALIAATLAFRVMPLFEAERLKGRDGLSDFCAELTGRDGLMLVAHPTAVRFPLRTRRAVLLDPEQVDIFTYVPAAAPEMERILNRVYGRTLLVERQEGEPVNIGPHLLPLEWPDVPLERWRELRREFNVTDVILPYGIPLQLPLLAEKEGYFSAYTIP